MLSVLKIEARRMGANVTIITASALIAITLLSMTGGDLVNLSLLGFEVLCPILIAILVCEWVQTLSDPMIEIIMVHSRSLFAWVVGRYIVVTGISGMLCVLCMIGLRLFVLDFQLFELLLVFTATSVFFTSFGVFSSFFSRQPHMPVAICGTFWLISLVVRSAVRFPGIALFHPMLRFVDGNTNIWVANKIILLIMSVLMWVWIYAKTRSGRQP